MNSLYKGFLSVKKNYPDTVLLFRVGDFVETLGDDAKIVSDTLDLASTGRDCGEYGRIRLTGFPYSALNACVDKLTEAGVKITYIDNLLDYIE